MAEAKTVVPPKADEFRYLPPPKEDFSWLPKHEGILDKFKRKAGENPFVPIGLGMTTVVLGLGLWQMRTGNVKRSQFFMRARIAAQGSTVAALLIGVWYSSKKGKEPPPPQR
ncbi:unnamed protein product [Owenia fusiformis]|uniref:HIG1 domain-containing protein n=1 Tax=Owenia fusiformis TaxID=6347 RepID=A0A8S4NNZ3_OWEFU|nr:unnamed protein product [Owenia fusiformis]